MIPLRVTATISGAICMPERPLALDALLAAAVATREGIQPALTRAELRDIDIPVRRSRCGRYHLATQAEFKIESYAGRYINRRPLIEQYQTIGNAAIKRVDTGSGPNKGYRIPMETVYLELDQLTWWCVGDRTETTSLLSVITHLGRRRAVGLGRVAAWNVSPCEPWEGFPVLRDGFPLRNLPLDTPGLSPDAGQAFAVLTYPYWRHEAEELCAVPLLQG